MWRFCLILAQCIYLLVTVDANEHPSVTSALRQVANNTLLKETLEGLLGKNPAVAEITAITAAPGAEPQGWHADVKQPGNAQAKARTFTHSYSLFLPLQDVHPGMGPTEVCPGTHYCANDLEEVCVKDGFHAAQSQIWKRGHGLVMNQKMWHRGPEYLNRSGPKRVVFIITFISRPDPGRDHRQLSHGTYFHIHPLMYGHTFQDLKNPQVSMSFPFNLLRSLGIWKPPAIQWGWDWVTSSALRIANQENGTKLLHPRF